MSNQQTETRKKFIETQVEAAQAELKSTQSEVIDTYLNAIQNGSKSLSIPERRRVIFDLERIVGVIQSKDKTKKAADPFDYKKAKIARVGLDATPAQLARILKTSPQAILGYEDGEKIPSTEEGSKGRDYLELLKVMGYNPHRL